MKTRKLIFYTLTLISVFSVALVGGSTSVFAAKTVTLKNSQIQATGASYDLTRNWTQGATVTKNYYIYTDWGGDSGKTEIVMCKRSNPTDCTRLPASNYAHASSIYHEWGTDYFSVIDSNTNSVWCFSISQKKQLKKANSCPQIDRSKLTRKNADGVSQGYTKYGDYYLRGWGNSTHKPNEILLYDSNKKLIATYKLPDWVNEIEDVAVDGKNGIVYFSTMQYVDGKKQVQFYSVDKEVFSQYIKPGQITKYTVTFDLNGLKVKGGKTAITKTVAFGKTVGKLSLELTDNTQTFNYWATKKDGKKAFNFATPIKKNITLYAINTKSDGSGGTAANTNDAACKSDAPDSVKATLGCEDTSEDGEESGSTTYAAGTLPATVIGIINGVIGALGIVAVIFILVGGINYMTSTGDTTKIEKAKKTIIYAAIGLVVCVLAFAVVNFVIGLF